MCFTDGGVLSDEHGGVVISVASMAMYSCSLYGGIVMVDRALLLLVALA